MKFPAFSPTWLRLLILAIVCGATWAAQSYWTQRAMGREVEGFTQVMLISRNYQGLALDTDGIANLLVKLVEARGDRFVSVINVKVAGFQPIERSFAADPMGRFTYVGINEFQVTLAHDEYQIFIKILEHHGETIKRGAYSLITGLAWLALVLIFIRWREKDLEVLRYEERDRIARQVAHDLRSPLTALETGIHFLNSNPEDSLDLLNRALKRVNEIATDVLKPMPPRTSDTVKVRALYSALTDDFAQLARALNCDISLKKQDLTEDQQDRLARGDLTKWSRILANLVTNAIEAYEPGKDKKIDIELTTTSKSLYISIKDFGRGMSDEVLAKAGQKGFSHGKVSGKSGSGLGLFDAKSTISNWGGHLHIDSAPGSGTMVTIEIPLVG